MHLTAARFPFLARLSDKAQRELGALTATKVRAGKRLLERGDDADGAYLVVGGALRVYYITDEGREATLYRVEPGGTCVLSVSASLQEAPYPAWVEAGAHGGEMVRVSNNVFHRLLDEERAFRQFVFGVLSGRIFELMQTLEELGSITLEGRVARYLLRRQDADHAVRISQLGIASELGTAREVVFRALRSLVDQGLIETGRMRIQILDEKRLKMHGK